MDRWINFVGYQVAWFAVVFAAGRGHPVLAIAAALAFAGWTWWRSPTRSSDLRLAAVALVLGVLVDGGLAASGWLRYASPQPGLLAPLWILALWVAFSMTINHSMRFLQGRPWTAAVLGAVGAPLAYLGAARGFEAVAFAPPTAAGLLGLAVGWGLAMPTLATLARRWTHGTPIPVLLAERST